MRILCEYYGGSLAYGLQTPESDKDVRGLYLSTEMSEIIGLQKNEQQTTQNTIEDSCYYELRSFLKLINKSNSQCYEMIFNNKWIIKTPEFDLIQSNREKLLNSENLFKCLRGYAESEKRQIFGVDTGKLGEKRKKAIELFGYSYRNASHAIRLLRCGAIFFKDNYYPVNIFEKDNEYGPLCKDIKVNPQNYNPKKIEKLIDKLDKELEIVFKNRGINYVFDYKFANSICYDLYLPILLDNKPKL
jgi:hypothetical protein